MTHGRHRQPSSVSEMLPWAAVVVLAVAGISLSLRAADTVLLRPTLSLACAVAGVLAVLMWQRDRQHARAMAVESSGRRRDQSLFQMQLHASYATLAALRGELGQLHIESGELRREMAALRSEKDEVLARLRTTSARQAQDVLAADSLSAAAEVLDAFATGGDGWVSSWVSGLFDDEGDLVIDLTMHDDTIPLELRAARSA